VLSKSTFFFPAGETTFVVGKSGSGKSTLGNLLMPVYEPTAGRILIDGTSIGELDINWLRNSITLVQQQSILFNETIFRNISFGQRDYLGVTKKQARVCIDLAALQSTIQDTPKGLDSQVGSGGSALSGGQKQRIAVARATLPDTPVLILNESTSALDYGSRKTVMEGIREWRRRKTTIVITHDISQIREDDFVYILEKG
jgi:ATP-binding cassette, subfamily B (MDR/TAP), member 1